MKQCHGLELRPEPCGIVSELPARCSASVGAVTAFSTQRWGSSALPVPVHTHFGAGFCHGGSFCQSWGSGRLEEPVPMLSAATHTEHGSLAHVAALWGVFIPASAVPGSLVVTHGAGRCRVPLLPRGASRGVFLALAARPAHLTHLWLWSRFSLRAGLLYSHRLHSRRAKELCFQGADLFLLAVSSPKAGLSGSLSLSSCSPLLSTIPAPLHPELSAGNQRTRDSVTQRDWPQTEPHTGLPTLWTSFHSTATAIGAEHGCSWPQWLGGTSSCLRCIPAGGSFDFPAPFARVCSCFSLLYQTHPI